MSALPESAPLAIVHVCDWISIEVVDVGVAVIKQVVPAKTEPATATTCDDPTISKFGVKVMDGLTIPYAI